MRFDLPTALESDEAMDILAAGRKGANQHASDIGGYLQDVGRDAADYAVDASLQYGPEAMASTSYDATTAEAPGFGVAVAVVALLGAATLALRRRNADNNPPRARSFEDEDYEREER